MRHSAFSVRSSKREELIDITSVVNKFVLESGMNEGILLLFCPHTTAGLTINENADASVKSDILSFLKEAVPKDPKFKHTEGNSDAHIKASLMGCSLFLILKSGRLQLGTWQGIYFCEFDGPRQRHISAAIIER